MLAIEKLIDLVGHYQNVFNLQSWVVHCYVSPLASMPADGAWGHIIVEHEYMRARLAVAEETPENDIEHVVCHEMAHMLTGMITHVVDGLIDELQKSRQKRERKLLEDANEMVTEMIARAIRRLENDSNADLDSVNLYASPTDSDNAH